ncbi:YfcC family protein [Siansivirga zeaxanthinifaciens]|uniref:C4-dicarboxylate ABC transporter n=1 Tax=Siansivirga zeaxanthinifaciens CC-SAMT-1 TaxID=1454006 RepID=A0A0C5WN24_9FLAO|nr:Na+/H+ antiporter NhaC family protein [Siansivirga zeaxanthinifaciens]AJR04240.1 C4-dicarboxylate ABC transporter [Siansivirga zeaxanthinifaciens CC-SAMT-1]
MKLFKKFPDTISIILGIGILFIILTWLIPAGAFNKELVNGREVIVANSYKHIPAQPQGIWAFLTFPIKGFVSASFVIAFVFLVGGAFSILTKTGAINAGLFKVITISKNRPQYKIFIIPSIVALFSLAGATFGMSEEILVFILITIPLSQAMGYDAIIGAAIPIVGTGVGFAGAFTNPFTIGIAQGIAQIPIFSGIEYRLVVWFILTLIACILITRYARKIDKDPTKSFMYDLEINTLEKFNKNDIPEFNKSRKLILVALFLALIILIYGVNVYQWYINEIAGLFIGLGIISALIYKMPVSKAIQAFIEGAKEMMSAALIIGLAKGLLVIAEDGKIIDTILNSVAVMAGDTPQFISVSLMFLFQSCLNFFIPSGSGQAALTMPIMAPLSDLLGISRQLAVLAFQFGDGLSNMIVPTSGVTMGTLSIAKIPYNVWFKWICPTVIILSFIAVLLLILPLFLFEW